MVEDIKVTFSGRLLYSGREVPLELVLDTTLYEDGIHELSVEVKRIYGGTSRTRKTIIVENYWDLHDEMLPPLNWGIFGTINQSKTSEMSSGWRYATDQPDDFFGDANRVVRSEGSAEYLVWKSPQLTEANVTLYSRSPRISNDDVMFLVSADGEEFGQIEYDQHQLYSSESGWYKIILSATKIDCSTAHNFKLLVQKGEIAAQDLQIGEVKLRGRN